MTPHELNREISRHAWKGEEYGLLFRELVDHPLANWTDWVRCMSAADEEVQKEAWRRLSVVGFPQWSLLSILGMPKTPEWVLPLAVSEVLSREPDDLKLCWLLYNTARQPHASEDFVRVVEVVKRRGKLENKFGHISEPIPPEIQEAVGDLLVSA